jgi:hypothetical protein
MKIELCEWRLAVIVRTSSRNSATIFTLRFGSWDCSFVTQGVPHATEPGISLIILTPMEILQRNLNRGTFVVWEMKRNVSAVCVCSAPNCCDTEQRSASQPGSVASGTPYIFKHFHDNNALISSAARTLEGNVCCIDIDILCGLRFLIMKITHKIFWKIFLSNFPSAAAPVLPTNLSFRRPIRFLLWLISLDS